MSLDEVALILTGELGRPIRYDSPVALEYAWHLRRRRGMPLVKVAVLTALNAGLARGNAAGVVPTLERLLGRPPREMETYVADHVHLWER